jgi:aspartyl-tRNA(Asn)/glutamyl-tRNA(Gln) amidotransferase subunit B
MTGETFSLRTKEEAEDYRYMPDANLPAMVIDPVCLPLTPQSGHRLTELQVYLDRLRGSIPEMPWDVVDRLVQQYGVTQRDLETLVGLDEYEGKGLRYYEDVTQGNEKIRKKALNW